VPRSQGGETKPTVYLCVPCHAAVHGTTWDPDHSALTKAALAAAKERGVRLGGWRGGPPVDQRLGTEAARRAADSFAADVGPIVRQLRGQGLSLRRIADALGAKGIKTARGGDAWTAAAVRNVLTRVGAGETAALPT
jgi:hypothetical protein